MINISGKDWKVLFLDSNAIREIAFDTKGSGVGFIKKFIKPVTYIPCMSIYNVMEMMGNEATKDAFQKFFSIVPFIMTFPYANILEEEIAACKRGVTVEINPNIAYSFTFLNQAISLSEFLEKIFWKKNVNLPDFVEQSRKISEHWEIERQNRTSHVSATLLSNEEYLQNEEAETMSFLNELRLNPPSPFNKDCFPTVRVMNFSKYHRIGLKKRKVTVNDVMDIQIMAVTPYVDAVITEKFQAEVLKKARKLIPQLSNLEVYTLRDIRKLDC